MKFTTIQVNLLILALILAALQVGILYILEFNGGDGVIADAVRNKDATIVALIFAPTTALTIALAKAGSYKEK